MRFAGLARATALVVALISTSACDDEPTCDMLVNLSGGLDEDLAWSLTGRDQCGLADATALGEGSRALVFVERAGDTYRQIIVTVRPGITQLPDAGNYTGQVLLVTPDDIWESAPDACTVVVASSQHEDWSRIDFVTLDGVVDCPAPLQSVSGNSPAVTMTTLGYSGHIFAIELEFDNL